MTKHLFQQGNVIAIARGVGATLALLVIWECVGRSGMLHISLFPPPSHVARALVEMAQAGEIVRDMGASLKRALLGLLLGSFLGAVVGMITGRVKLADNFISPIVQLFRPLPP